MYDYEFLPRFVHIQPRHEAEMCISQVQEVAGSNQEFAIIMPWICGIIVYIWHKNTYCNQITILLANYDKTTEQRIPCWHAIQNPYL